MFSNHDSIHIITPVDRLRQDIVIVAIHSHVVDGLRDLPDIYCQNFLAHTERIVAPDDAQLIILGGDIRMTAIQGRTSAVLCAAFGADDAVERNR